MTPEEHVAAAEGYLDSADTMYNDPVLMDIPGITMNVGMANAHMRLAEFKRGQES